MPLRFAVTKVSGQGEQITVDISSWNPVTGIVEHQDVAEMSQLLNQAMDFVDTRLLEMNMRMLEAYNLRNYFAPDAWQKVVAIFDVLAGRQDIATVKQRWDAALEETKDLEQMREAAYHDKQAEQAPDFYSMEEQEYYGPKLAAGECICSAFTVNRSKVKCPVHEDIVEITDSQY